MLYDPIRAQLAISSDELGRLLDVMTPASRDAAPPTGPASGGDTDGAPLGSAAERSRWTEAGIMIDGRFHPTVEGMVGVLSHPTRSVVIERFCRNVVVPLFVAWDATGRATLTDGIPGGDLTIEATGFDLLPSLLLQAVHLHGGTTTPDDDDPVVTTAGAIEQVFDPDGGSDHPVDEHLAGLLTDLRFAWRASGSWPGRETDISVTVLCTRARGLWTVSRPSQDRSGSLSPESRVVLAPTAAAAVAARLGDVVTGRASVPNAA